MYAREMTEASKSALLEIGLVLKRYRTDMVLSGGWAPYFITNGYFEHCGSIDIDLVLRTKVMKKYETIKKSILRLGYIEENPFRFSRTVKSRLIGHWSPNSASGTDSGELMLQGVPREHRGTLSVFGCSNALKEQRASY